MPARVSIILCTRNRAQSLRETVASLGRCIVPADLPTELLIVDNGSSDSTPDIAAQASLSNMSVRYVREERVGKCIAYNHALNQAAGEIYLFTDDDVRVPTDWIERMCRPIAQGLVDAVSGGIRLAPHLQRSWMTPTHRGWLAELNRNRTMMAARPYLVGANMAFSRKILERIPQFDSELGPGKSGYGDDGLLSLQMGIAGFRAMEVAGADVEHHFDASRLDRESFLNAARKMGETEAYLAHHWEHRRVTLPRLRYWKHRAELAMARIKRRGEYFGDEGGPIWELDLIKAVAMYKRFLDERRRPRNYELNGLIKKVRP